MNNPMNPMDSYFEPVDHESESEQFFRALRFGITSQVIKLLQANPELCNKTDAHGNTPMHWAVKTADPELMKSLFDLGASLNIATTAESHMYPIHWAASEGKIIAMKFLIEKYVDINIPDNHGCTPFIVATQHNMINSVLFLWKNGANLEAVDNNGDNALHWAAYKGHLDMVGLLAFLMPQCLNSTDKFGQSAVHLAALKGHHEVLEYLISDNQSKFNLKDNNGSLPLDLAIRKFQFKCEWCLRKWSTSNIIALLYSLGLSNLSKPRVMVAILFGGNDKELANWPWRVVFISNLCASVITAFIMTEPSMVSFSLLHCFNAITQGFWWFCFLSCYFVSPGIVRDIEAGDNNSYLNTLSSLVAFDETGDFLDAAGKIVCCHTCHLRRPLRSKHCKMLRKCIHKFDHFCPFVGNTIGRDNYKFFVGLLFIHIISGISWEITAYLYSCKVEISWTFLSFMVYAALWIAVLAGLLNYHIMLLCNNLTTNEYIGANKYNYLRGNNGAWENPFLIGGGAMKNILDGLFPSTRVYFSRSDISHSGTEQEKLLQDQSTSDRHNRIEY